MKDITNILFPMGLDIPRNWTIMQEIKPVIFIPALDLQPINEQMHLAYLKAFAIFNQDQKCICGKVLSLSGIIDGHHCLLTKQDVRGSKQKDLINHPYNIMAIHRDCHETITRPESASFQSDMYGHSRVIEWYYSLPFYVVNERMLMFEGDLKC